MTNLVSSITQPGCNCGYGYDDNGNIASATLNGKWTGYTYDALGQLIQVNDRSDTRSGENGTTWKYTYDLGGNILKKERFAYADTTSPLETVTYTYGDANWRDKLTVFNGNDIAYDAIGNPLHDGTWTYTWQNGRQLQKMQKSGVTAEFVYNADGLRVQKTVNGVATKYTLHGKNIVHMTSGTDELHFFYDAQNRPAVVVYNGVPYAYVKSLQGDIVAILDENGNMVVSYGYDAWGAPLWCTGELAETLGKVQPFRYRGYVFDEETGLYYLRSRYYNSELGRFLNADTIYYCNLFCYCKNSPTRRFDANGKEDEDVYLNVYAATFDVAFRIRPLSVGHVDIQIGDTIYAFGRYGETWGILDMKGMGILKVGDAASMMQAQSESNNKKVIRAKLSMSHEQVNQLKENLNDIIKNNSKYESTDTLPQYDYYRLTNDYDLFSNNCTTFAMNLLYDIYGDEMGGMQDAWAPYQVYRYLMSDKRPSFVEFIYPTYDSYIE